MAPTTRRQRRATRNAEEEDKHVLNETTNANENENESSDEEIEDTYTFNGKEYDSYTAMVDAKRKRNREVLMKSGLMEAVDTIKEAARAARASQRGLRKRRKAEQSALPRRKSSRLAGVQADGAYVENERSGKFTIIAGQAAAKKTDDEPEEPSFFDDRINDGSDLSVKGAVEHAGAKWVREDSVASADNFVRGTLAGMTVCKKSASRKSPTSVVSVDSSRSLRSALKSISLDDETCVAKVTPERIYSVACHPSSEVLLVGAGDKRGHVGLWNVDHVQEGEDSTNGVHLFKVHNRPVSNLEWTPSGSSLLSSSYDGTVRWFDVASEKFEQIFATYDDSVTYRKELGRGLDEGRSYWLQFCTLDSRNSSDQCFFLSTSAGTAMHVDKRAGKNRLTFHEVLSEKKINTLSLHPNGTTLASAGLDCTVRLWDVRMLKNNRTSRHQSPKPFAIQRCSKSINSAFFSPSGSSLLSTTMANTLELVEDAHLEKEAITSANRIRHDNMTGRWLSTFMAKWHPHHDIFVVGSMQRPRTIEVFDAQGSLLRGVQGEALTAVASRCCFHPSTDKIMLVGGNSSGRMTVAR